MGSGSWHESDYVSYSTNSGRTIDEHGFSSTQDMFKSRHIDKNLDPCNVIRECCDSEEHPNTIPVILALDVTGSMGSACKRVAQSLNVIMKNLYKKYKDIEFMIMGIGDLAYDDAPIQASQFESDIRIAEQTDKIYFEAGGGGNSFESYTAAWYFGLHNCKLDCWKRNKKGIIITLGDEPLNPYLPIDELNKSLGSNVKQEIDTKSLYKEVKKKYDIYHIAIEDDDTNFSYHKKDIEDSWGKLLKNDLFISTLNDLPKVITTCIDKSLNNEENIVSETKTSEGIPTISW